MEVFVDAEPEPRGVDVSLLGWRPCPEAGAPWRLSATTRAIRSAAPGRLRPWRWVPCVGRGSGPGEGFGLVGVVEELYERRCFGQKVWADAVDGDCRCPGVHDHGPGQIR